MLNVRISENLNVLFSTFIVSYRQRQCTQNLYVIRSEVKTVESNLKINLKIAVYLRTCNLVWKSRFSSGHRFKKLHTYTFYIRQYIRSIVWNFKLTWIWQKSKSNNDSVILIDITNYKLIVLNRLLYYKIVL